MFQPNYLNTQVNNPMMNAQQRLMQLEQQQNMMGNNGGMMQQQMPYQQQGIYLKGRAVTGIEEVRGTIIDQDGSLFIFPDIGHNKIYTKQINIDGIATINSFALEKMPAQSEQKFVEVEQMNQIINNFNQQIQVLQQRIEELTSTKKEPITTQENPSATKAEEKAADKTKISW